MDNKLSYRDKILQGAKYRNAGGPAQKELDPNDTTLTFRLTNLSSTADGIARLFGANIDLGETYNTAQRVTVEVLESSHRQVKSQSMQGGFRIYGMHIKTTTAAQLSNPLSIIEKTAAGKTVSRKWQPDNYTDPRNYNALMIKTSDFQMSIDGEASIEVTLEASEEVRLITHIKDMVRTVNAIKGEAVVESVNPYQSY